MLRKKQVLALASILVISFLVGTTFNATTMPKGGTPFDMIWDEIHGLQSGIRNCLARIETLEEYIENHSFISGAKYIIENDGGTYKAFDGQTGELYTSGINATAVIQYVIDNGLTSGRTTKEVIKFKGSFVIDADIYYDNYTIFDCYGAYFKIVDNPTHQIRIFVNRADVAPCSIHIYGGEFDGNRQNKNADVVTNAFKIGIGLSNVEDIVIKDGYYHDWQNGDVIGGHYGALRFCSALRAKVLNCRFDDNEYGDMVPYCATETVIEGNLISVARRGVMSMLQGQRIINNYFIADSDTAEGIRVKGQYADRWLIEDNIFQDFDGTHQFAIKFDNAEANGGLIQGNQFINSPNAFAGIGYADDYKIRYNSGFATENGGVTRNLADGGWISHGLDGTPDIVTLTSLNATYDNYCVIVAWDQPNTNSTHISVDIKWAHNGSAITDSVIDISWYAEYKP